MRTPRADRVLIALCITQVISWGTLYYTLPAVAAAIVADTGWSLVMVMGAFSAGLLTSAALGIAVGHLLDRFGGRTVMASSSVLALAGVALLATSSTMPAFVIAWIVIGVAQAGVLYQPAFTVIGLHHGTASARPLLILTLVAGLASTLYVPLASALTGLIGWRHAYLVLGGILAVTTIPLHALLLPVRTHAVPARAGRGHRPRPAVVRSSRFIRLCLGVTLLCFSLYAVTLNLIPLLGERGIDPSTAALLLGLVGVGQVIGRIALTTLDRVIPPALRPMSVAALSVLVLAGFAAVTGPLGALIALALLAGAARGALTLIQATAILDRWGTERLGTLNGIFAAPVTAATALAPVAGVALAAALQSFPLATATLTGIALIGAALVLERPTRPRKRRGVDGSPSAACASRAVQ